MSPMPNPDSKRPAIGPVGEQVVRNVEELREARGLSLRDLSKILGNLGRPILPSMLQALSKGGRRVDADDLVALAIALRVNPDALLLPRDADWQDPVDLTPEVSQPAWIAWEWADGRMPLPEGPPPFPHVDVPDAARADFAQHARASLSVHGKHPAVSSAEVLLTRIKRATNEMNEGNIEWWHAYIRRALTGLTVSLDDWFASPPPSPGGEDQ